MKIVPPTPTIEDVHTSCGVSPSEVRISDRSGVIANQMKKALKKENQAQWKARMCGRLKLHNLICVDLSS